MPGPVKTSTCRYFVTISSGFGRFFAMAFIRFPKHSRGPIRGEKTTFGLVLGFTGSAISADCKDCFVDAGRKKATGKKWSPHAAILLENAPDQKALLDIFVDRIPPRSWSGSRAEIMEQISTLLDMLPGGVKPETKLHGAQLRRKMQKHIEQERDWEKKRSEAEDVRFE